MPNANGHVIAGTPIAVDLWNEDSRCNARVFFLSHFHADHYAGLNQSWDRPVYASRTTTRLVEEFLGVNPSLLKPLEPFEEYLIFYDDSHKDDSLSVRTFDANHTRGSLMFLFEGAFGSVFYTGDFRYDASMRSSVCLPNLVDIMYLDNTYWNTDVHVPSRDAATSEFLDVLTSCCLSSDRVLVGLDRFGKEELLQRASVVLGSKIHVPDGRRRRVIEILGPSDYVTKDEDESMVTVVPLRDICTQLRLYRYRYGRVSAIVPTARFKGLVRDPFVRCSDIHVVEYSLHSPRAELLEFIEHVKPKKLLPIVAASSSYELVPSPAPLRSTDSAAAVTPPTQDHHCFQWEMGSSEEINIAVKSETKDGCGGGGASVCANASFPKLVSQRDTVSMCSLGTISVEKDNDTVVTGGRSSPEVAVTSHNEEVRKMIDKFVKAKQWKVRVY